MTNIQFPSTNLVECVFSWRQNDTYATANWDEYDHRDPIHLKRYIYGLPDDLVGKVAIGDTVLVHCKTGSDCHYQRAGFVRSGLGCSGGLRGQLGLVHHRG